MKRELGITLIVFLVAIAVTASVLFSFYTVEKRHYYTGELYRVGNKYFVSGPYLYGFEISRRKFAHAFFFDLNPEKEQKLLKKLSGGSSETSEAARKKYLNLSKEEYSRYLGKQTAEEIEGVENTLNDFGTDADLIVAKKSEPNLGIAGTSGLFFLIILYLSRGSLGKVWRLLRELWIEVNKGKEV